jgi:hypothetical protein
MKKYFLLITIAAAIVGFGFGCSTDRLEVGGSYAQPGQAPDLILFQTDSSFDLAFTATQALFKFERDNREMFWKISPDIKHSLDKARPVAFECGKEYQRARAAYLLNPSPEGLDTMKTVLSKMSQIYAAAATVIQDVQLNQQQPSMPPAPPSN